MSKERSHYNGSQSTSKKTIVVVGKTNHGKTSFVNMVKMDPSLIEKSPNSNDISQFNLYKVNPSKIINPFSSRKEDDLFIVDTPGLNPKQSIFIAVERLESFILKNHLEIVTVAYMVDIDQGRQKDQNGEGVLFTFLNLLKMKLSIKKNIIICVLPRFDQRYKKTQRNQKLLGQFQQDFQDRNLSEIWQNRIDWMSRPECDCEAYEQIIRNRTQKNEVAHNSQRAQWNKLQNHLKKVIQNRQYLPFKDYASDLQAFRRTITNNIANVYNQRGSFTRGTFQIEYTVTKEERKSSDEGYGFTKFINPSILSIAVGLALLIVGSVIVHYEYADFIAGYIGEIAISGGTAYLVYKCCSLKQIPFNVDPNDFRIVKDVLAAAQLTNYIKNNIKQSMKFDSNSIYMNKLLGITNISGVIVNKNQNHGTAINFERKDESYQGKICEEGKLKLIYEVKIPTNESYQIFLKKEISRYYNQMII